MLGYDEFDVVFTYLYIHFLFVYLKFTIVLN